MMEQILDEIRGRGGRITRVKEQVIRALYGRECLLSAAEIMKSLNRKGLKPDRTTLYRELLYLADNHIVKKQNVGGKDYYELCRGHHHHLLPRCHAIRKVEMKDKLAV